MYVYFFKLVDPNSLSNSLQLVPQEPGYVLLMMLSRRFSDAPETLFFVAAALTVFPTLIAIRRLSVSPALSYFLYFFLAYFAMSMNSVRQSIAVAFMLLGESYRRDSKPIWIFCTAIAVAFHSSAAIVFLLQLAVSRWKPTLASALAFILLITPALLFVLNWAPTRNALIALNSRYETYFVSEAGGLGTYLNFGLKLVIVILLLWAARVTNSRLDYRWLAYSVISVAILLLGTTSWVFARLEPYFGIYAILLIPAAVQGLKHRIGIVAVASLAALLYFGVHITAFNGLVPYQTS